MTTASVRDASLFVCVSRKMGVRWSRNGDGRMLEKMNVEDLAALEVGLQLPHATTAARKESLWRRLGLRRWVHCYSKKSANTKMNGNSAKLVASELRL